MEKRLEINNDEWKLLQEYSKGLLGCFEEKMQYSGSKDIIIDEAIKIAMNYAMSIINLHLSLYELKFERYAHNQNKMLDNK
jgi:hypothetical protein